jgi:hypothetical protein
MIFSSRRLGGILLLQLALSGCATAAAESQTASAPNDKPSVAQLAWLTGAWEGPLGPRILEERWAPAIGNAMTALVRFRENDALETLELVSITETADSLELRIQQWDPAMVARAPAQTMTLAELGPRYVRFDAATEGGIKVLGYRRTGEDQLTVEVTLTEGNVLNIPLEARP